MKKKNNILSHLTVESIAPGAVSQWKEFVQTLKKAHEADIITEQEQVLYFTQLGDHTKDWGYFHNLNSDLLFKLAKHHTATSTESASIFEFKTDYGMIDVRPIVEALDMIGGVTGIASILDTVLFAYIENVAEVGDSERKDIADLKMLRNGLLRAGKSIELESWRMRRSEATDTEKLSGSDLCLIRHRIPDDSEAEAA